jgi:hypothetical protein
MEAVRLIRASRQALERAERPAELIAEAWQAQALAEAVGSHLALHGAPELRSAGFSVSAAGGRACGAAPPSATRAGPVRAALLTGVRDPCVALRELRDLLVALHAALSAAARAATDDPEMDALDAGFADGDADPDAVAEGAGRARDALDYGTCLDAVDAAAESRDLVITLLHTLEGAASPI